MKRIILLFGMSIMAFVVLPSNVLAGACNSSQPGCINTIDIADGAVIDSKIPANEITAAKIADGPDSGLNADLLDGLDSTQFTKKYENVIVVAKSGGDYTTIQAAVDAAIAASPSSGVHLIKVMPGTYTEDITIDDEVNLQGSGAKSTRIKPATANGTAITMDWGYGLISGFSFISNGNSTAISLINSEPITIKDNYFYAIQKGIAVTDSEVIIEDNAFNYVTSAVYVGSAVSSAELTVTGNNFTGDYNCSTSIHIKSLNANLKAKNNRFKGIACAPFYIGSSNSAVILNNYIYGVSGPQGSAGIQVKGNSITVEGNYVTNNGYDGISFTSSQSAIIKNNIVTKSSPGILSNSASGAITITNNHLAGNTLYDIQNYGSVTPNISFNTFETCYGISPSSMNVKAAGTPWDGSCI